MRIWIALAPLLLAAAAEGQGPTAPLCAEGGAGPGARMGRVLVTNQQSQSASVIDLASGNISHVPLPGANPHGGAVSPDGAWGVVADYGNGGRRLFVIDMAQRKLVRTIELDARHRHAHDVAFVGSSSQRVVVTAQGSREILDVDIATGTVLGIMGTQGGGSHSLAIADDGRTVVSANEEETFISLLDLTSHSFISAIRIDKNPYGIAITPDGKFALVGTQGDIKVVDIAARTVAASIAGVTFPDDISMGADGSRAAIADQSAHRVHFADVPNRRIIASIAVNRPHSAYLHPDSRTIYATLGSENALAVIDAVRGCVVAKYQVGSWPDEVGWGPGGR